MNQATEKVKTRSIQKKITVKILNGGRQPSVFKLAEYLRDHPGETVMPLCTIVGRASAFEPGSSDFGPYIKLLGQFEGVNAESGEVIVSGTAILPGAANDLVYGTLRGAMEQGGSIEFAFRIGLVKDETLAIGYRYAVEQMIAPSTSDPLADLKALAGMPGSGTPKLEAPKPKSEPEPEPEPKPAPAAGKGKGK